MSIDLTNRYRLLELPAPIRRYDQEELQLATTPTLKPGEFYVWSAASEPPRIGSRVVVRINDLGAGTVESYFVEHGYVGVRVRLDSPPAWHRRQNGNTPHAGHCLVFGAELAEDR